MYTQHKKTRMFEHINIYLGWLRYKHCMVCYLQVHVLRQFGYMLTFPRLPHEYASRMMTQLLMSKAYTQFHDHVQSLEHNEANVRHRV